MRAGRDRAARRRLEMVSEAAGPGPLVGPRRSGSVLSAGRACWDGNRAAGIAREPLGAAGRWGGRRRPEPCGGRPRRCPAPLRCVNAADPSCGARRPEGSREKRPCQLPASSGRCSVEPGTSFFFFFLKL